METPQLTPAERMYKKHLENVSNYQRRNPEKMRAKYRSKMEAIKADPEKYEEYKRQRREYDKTFREKKKQAKLDSDSGGEEPSEELVAQIREDNAENFQENEEVLGISVNTPKVIGKTRKVSC
jgi:hypothetical protein